MKKSLLTIALGFIGFASFAQANVASHNVKVNASSVLEITMTSTADVELSFATSADYEGGKTAVAAAELKVKSTKPWSVAVSTSATNFDAILAANDTSALTVKKTGAAADVAITSGSAIATGTKGGNSATSNTFTIDYALNPGYFAQDTYTVPVTFTVSHP
jgi:hypothetical protein